MHKKTMFGAKMYAQSVATTYSTLRVDNFGHLLRCSNSSSHYPFFYYLLKKSLLVGECTKTLAYYRYTPQYVCNLQVSCTHFCAVKNCSLSGALWYVLKKCALYCTFLRYLCSRRQLANCSVMCGFSVCWQSSFVFWRCQERGRKAQKKRGGGGGEWRKGGSSKLIGTHLPPPHDETAQTSAFHHCPHCHHHRTTLVAMVHSSKSS